MIPVAKWGKDHWSTFAYIETRCVDHKGLPEPRHMRTDVDLHPGLARADEYSDRYKTKYPTRLKDSTEVFGHDDWSCLEDAEAAGFLEIHGTGLHPWYQLTELGRRVANALREHKEKGGVFHSFVWSG